MSTESTTTQNTPVEPTQEAPGAAQTPDATPDTPEAPAGAQEPDETSAPSKEAARYRRRLRDAEAERDTLASQVEALQKAEVERVASRTLKQPAGLWAAGVNLADLLDESGAVDEAKVRDAAAQAREDLGLAGSMHGNIAPKEGRYSDEGDPAPRDDWADVIRGNR